MAEAQEKACKRYSDTGCEYAPSCLDCPFPQCKLDLPAEARGVRAVKKRRNERIVKLYGEGKNPREIAEILGVSIPTIRNVLRATCQSSTNL